MAGGTGFISEECVSNILGSALVSPPLGEPSRDRAMINCRRDKKRWQMDAVFCVCRNRKSSKGQGQNM